jgi:hypothetical protein
VSDFEDDFVPDEVQDGAEEPDDFAPDDDAGSGRASRVLQLPETRIEGAVDRNVAPRRSMLERIGDVFAPGEANAQPLRGRLEEVFSPTAASPQTGIDRRGEAGAAAVAGNMALGFEDEIGGALRSVAGGGSYEQERDALRARSRAATEQNPQLATIGEVPALAVSMAAPGLGGASRMARGARMIGAGAAQAGAMSAGASEADTAGDVAGDALGGAALGGALGTAGAALGGAPGAARRFLAARLGRLRGAADEARVLTAMGATGGTISRPQVLQEAARVPGPHVEGAPLGEAGKQARGIAEVARVMRANGMGGMVGADALAERATRSAEESREAIRAIIESVEASGERVSQNEFATRLREAAAELADRPQMDDMARALRREATRYEQRFAGTGGMTMGQAQANVSDLGRIPNWVRASTGQQIPNAQEAAIVATRTMRDQMDDAAERAFSRTGAEVPEALANSGPYRSAIGRDTDAGRSAVEGYRGARRLNQVSRIVADAANQSVQRGRKNRLWGLQDAQTALVAGGGLGGLAAALGRRAVVGRGAAARATGLEALVAIARSNPERLGRFARLISNASQRGGAELAATHYALQRDPEYRQLSAEIAAENEE